MAHGRVDVVGTIWLPPVTAATSYNLSNYDVENMIAYEYEWFDGERELTRRAVEHWLSLNSGDFQSITDFYAVIVGEGWSFEVPWKSEDNELVFSDCMWGELE